MLKLYQNVNNFPEFCEKIYFSAFNQHKSYNELLVDYDVFILNSNKYTTEDVEKYLEFFKYNAFNAPSKIAIINNFDLIDMKIQNKLLKVFEESQELQIIVTKNKKKILPTILSRALAEETVIEKYNYEKYPKKYQNLLNLITLSKNDYYMYLEDEKLVLLLYKFFEYLLNREYKTAYILYSTESEILDSATVYILLQEAHKKITQKINLLFDLQERLVTKTNSRIQIENYLLALIEGEM